MALSTAMLEAIKRLMQLKNFGKTRGNRPREGNIYKLPHEVLHEEKCYLHLVTQETNL